MSSKRLSEFGSFCIVMIMILLLASAIGGCTNFTEEDDKKVVKFWETILDLGWAATPLAVGK